MNYSFVRSGLILFTFFFADVTFMLGQNTEIESKKQTFFDKLTFDAEYRPRAELKRGYRSLPSDSSEVAFLISHRARLNLTYKTEGFLFHSSFQDVRIWGDTAPGSAEGSVQLYEFYVEPQIYKDWYVRVGRQRVSFGDERLFSRNEWRQTASQHDAVRLFYRDSKLKTEILGAFNQNKDQLFGTQYDVNWETYKVLVANFIEFDITKKWSFAGINFGDAYADPAQNGTGSYWKYTHGGNFRLNTNRFGFMFGGYYQHGKINSGEKLNAFYLQQELKYLASLKYSARLGLQIFSGDNNPNDGVSHSFLAQYGAFHLFNGGMDYTLKTVRTYNHEGIINPYLIQDYKINSKYKISWESHVLATQKQLLDDNGDKLHKFYGWENDLKLMYVPNNYTQVELAYLFMVPGKTLEYLPTGSGGTINNIPQFAYIQVQWTPNLLN